MNWRNSIVENWSRDAPKAFELAKLVSFSSLVEPAYLRAMRIELASHLNAGYEADLWLSPFVLTRNPTGFVWEPKAAEELRRSLAQDPVLYETAWTVSQPLHAYLPSAVRLEEEVCYLQFSTNPDSRNRIKELVRFALSAMVEGGQKGIANWAARALPRFPAEVLSMNETRVLRAGAHMRLATNMSGPALLTSERAEWMGWVAPEGREVKVGLRLFFDRLEIFKPSTEMDSQTTKVIELPNTDPLILEIEENIEVTQSQEQRKNVNSDFAGFLPFFPEDEEVALTLSGNLNRRYGIPVVLHRIDKNNVSKARSSLSSGVQEGSSLIVLLTKGLLNSPFENLFKDIIKGTETILSKIIPIDLGQRVPEYWQRLNPVALSKTAEIDSAIVAIETRMRGSKAPRRVAFRLDRSHFVEISSAPLRVRTLLGAVWELAESTSEMKKAELHQQKEVPSSAKRCFVISPIGQEGSSIRHHADDVFEFIIQPAMTSMEIKSLRIDHMKETGLITKQMIKEIIQSDICIAILSGNNPNVFYQLAVAQAASRPAILLIEKGQDLPFDIQNLRIVEYSLQPVASLIKGVFAKKVEKQVRSIQEQGWMAPSLFQEFSSGHQIRWEQQLPKMMKSARPSPLPPRLDKDFELPLGQQRRIKFVTGDIQSLPIQADVIVSLVDINLQLARYHDLAISGTLRYLDAEKTAGGVATNDTLNEALQEEIVKLGLKPPFSLGSVIATKTNGLRELGFKYVFHVAGLQGSLNSGYHTMGDLLSDCVRNAFLQFSQLAKREDSKLESILFPILGASTSGLEMIEVVEKLLKSIVEEMAETDSCQTVYILAWLEPHLHALHQIATKMKLKEVAESA